MPIQDKTCVIRCSVSRILMAFTSTILSVWAMYIAGMLDAEIGARLTQNGISFYLTPPSHSKRYAVVFIFWVSVLSLCPILMGIKRFVNNSALRIIAPIAAVYFGGALLVSEMWASLPCSRQGRLTVNEFRSRHLCRNEKFIDRAIQMLEGCPFKPAINRTSIDAFLALHPNSAFDNSALSRIQVGRSWNVLILLDQLSVPVFVRLSTTSFS